MSTSPRAGATSDPASEHELTPAQEAMDARDWSFGGAWPYEPRWHRADGVRLHYVDEGPSANEAVVMLHGSPTWGFLYRKLIAGLRDRDQRALSLIHISEP